MGSRTERGGGRKEWNNPSSTKGIYTIAFKLYTYVFQVKSTPQLFTIRQKYPKLFTTFHPRIPSCEALRWLTAQYVKLVHNMDFTVGNTWSGQKLIVLILVFQADATTITHRNFENSHFIEIDWTQWHNSVNISIGHSQQDTEGLIFSERKSSCTEFWN